MVYNFPHALLQDLLRERVLRWVDGVCLVCGAPARVDPGLCPACDALLPRDQELVPPAGIDRVVAACRYDWPVDRLIAAFKYRGGIAIGAMLARRLLAVVRQARVDAPPIDALLPVPLHPRRFRERRFNQAHEIAAIVAAGLGLPLMTASRLSMDPPQAGLGAARRRRNRPRFRLWQDPGGKRLAIIDDVLTTGTTARALADCCRGRGAEWVEVWCLARAPESC